MFTLHASGIGSGIAIGTARIIHRAGEEITEFSVADNEVENEVARLADAIDRARASIIKIRDDLPHDAPEEIDSFLAIHLMIMEDPALSEKPTAIIRARKINAEAALHRHAPAWNNFSATFKTRI